MRVDQGLNLRRSDRITTSNPLILLNIICWPRLVGGETSAETGLFPHQFHLTNPPRNSPPHHHARAITLSCLCQRANCEVRSCDERCWAVCSVASVCGRLWELWSALCWSRCLSRQPNPQQASTISTSCMTKQRGEQVRYLTSKQILVYARDVQYTLTLDHGLANTRKDFLIPVLISSFRGTRPRYNPTPNAATRE